MFLHPHSQGMTLDHAQALSCFSNDLAWFFGCPSSFGQRYSSWVSSLVGIYVSRQLVKCQFVLDFAANCSAGYQEVAWSDWVRSSLRLHQDLPRSFVAIVMASSRQEFFVCSDEPLGLGSNFDRPGKAQLPNLWLMASSSYALALAASLKYKYWCWSCQSAWKRLASNRRTQDRVLQYHHLEEIAFE